MSAASGDRGLPASPPSARLMAARETEGFRVVISGSWYCEVTIISGSFSGNEALVQFHRAGETAQMTLPPT